MNILQPVKGLIFTSLFIAASSHAATVYTCDLHTDSGVNSSSNVKSIKVTINSSTQATVVANGALLELVYNPNFNPRGNTNKNMEEWVGADDSVSRILNDLYFDNFEKAALLIDRDKINNSNADAVSIAYHSDQGPGFADYHNCKSTSVEQEAPFAAPPAKLPRNGKLTDPYQCTLDASKSTASDGRQYMKDFVLSSVDPAKGFVISDAKDGTSSPNKYVHLKKSGSKFVGYYSADGKQLNSYLTWLDKTGTISGDGDTSFEATATLKTTDNGYDISVTSSIKGASGVAVYNCAK